MKMKKKREKKSRKRRHFISSLQSCVLPIRKEQGKTRTESWRGGIISVFMCVPACVCVFERERGKVV